MAADRDHGDDGKQFEIGHQIASKQECQVQREHLRHHGGKQEDSDEKHDFSEGDSFPLFTQPRG